MNFSKGVKISTAYFLAQVMKIQTIRVWMVKEIEQPLILICDDTSKNIQVLGTILMDKGYQITVAEDGTECLKMLETVRPDLILLDVMMPYLNGYQTCEKIKNNPLITNIPIIFLSAKNEAEDIVKGLELGAVDYVSKPFNSVELLQRVKTQLEIKKNRDIIVTQQQSLSLLLNNIHEGFFIFDSSGHIEPGWTISVKNFLGEDPEGKCVFDYLPFKEKEKNYFKKWFQKLWTSQLSIKDLIPLAPKNFIYKEKYFELNFIPIFHSKEGERKKLDKVICNLIDKTHEKECEEKAEKEKNYVSMMFSVLKDPFDFLDFIEERSEIVSNLLESLREKLKSWNEKDPIHGEFIEYGNSVFRAVHTIKAESLKYFLGDIKNLCARVEDIIFKTREEKKEPLREPLRDILELLQKINGAFSQSFFSVQSFLDVINREEGTGSFKRVELHEVYEFLIKNLKNDQEVLKKFEKTYFKKEIDFFFKGQDKMLQNLAKDRQKDIEFKIKPSSIKFDMNIYSSFFSTLIHVLRNALDHGIEEKNVRSTLGKEEKGIIEISCHEKNNEKISIILYDDGRGIDPVKIRSHLIESGENSGSELEEKEDKEIIQHIFLPGFSTKKERDHLSGFGVGLDAVKNEVQKLKGEIIVESNLGESTRFIIELPIKNNINL